MKTRAHDHMTSPSPWTSSLLCPLISLMLLGGAPTWWQSQNQSSIVLVQGIFSVQWQSEHCMIEMCPLLSSKKFSYDQNISLSVSPCSPDIVLYFWGDAYLNPKFENCQTPLGILPQHSVRQKEYPMNPGIPPLTLKAPSTEPWWSHCRNRAEEAQALFPAHSPL